jgi:hypothetical protein
MCNPYGLQRDGLWGTDLPWGTLIGWWWWGMGHWYLDENVNENLLDKSDLQLKG